MDQVNDLLILCTLAKDSATPTSCTQLFRRAAHIPRLIRCKPVVTGFQRKNLYLVGVAATCASVFGEARSRPSALLEMDTVYGSLGHDDRLQAAFAHWLGALHQRGVEATLSEYLGKLQLRGFID